LQDRERPMNDLNGVIEMIPWALLGALAILVLFL
jgi:hypothetical protein